MYGMKLRFDAHHDTVEILIFDIYNQYVHEKFNLGFGKKAAKLAIKGKLSFK